jgi:hypothetical protein
MQVYYLTPAPFAITNIALRRVKISRFADLNDPFELLPANLVDPKHRRAFSKMKHALNETKGLICFSSNWKNPLLWGHYADKHTGIALGFEIPDEELTRVIYATHRVALEIDRASNTPIMNEDLVNRLLRTKFIDWKYEDEYRTFVQLDPATKEAGLYFMDFSNKLLLNEVVLGPRCELPINRIRSLLSSYGSPVRVVKSRMAFRTFKVTVDRAQRWQDPNDA